MRIRGCDLETHWHGPPPDAAPTLVFLHAGLGSATTWRDLPARVAATTGLGVLVYSRAGHGASEAMLEPLPLDFIEREAFEALPELVAATRLREFVLVGHSDGGSMSLVYAGSVGHEGLKGVATLAAHVFCEEETVHSAHQAKLELETGDLLERLEKHHGEKAGSVFESWFDVWTHPDFRAWSIESHLPAIDVPLLVVQGEDDEYGTRAQVDAIAGATGAGAAIAWLPDCGHALHRDQGEVVEALLTDFASAVFEDA